MSSVVSKAQTGKFCLGSNSAVTQESSKLQTALATRLKNETESYATGTRGTQQYHRPRAASPSTRRSTKRKEQNLATVKAKLDEDNVTKLLTQKETIARATSSPASTCPLTSIAQDDKAGIYREHTVAGMWTITGTTSSTLVATYKADKMDTIKALAKSSKASAPTRGTTHGKRMHACRHELVHGRRRAGKGEDRSDTAGGKGKSRRTQKRQRSTQSSNAKGNRNGTQKSQAPTKGKGNRRAKEGTRGKHAR
ncbi:hypothetical protein ERJ75_000701000 [Trypanosoma vivax]|nr:hypothetical protein ERJ75_000701000 [Trypanosoma vivax]